MLRVFVLAALFFAVAGCSKKIDTKQPSEYYDRASLEKVISTINIPVTYSLYSVEQKINRAVKGTLYEDNNLQDDNLAIKVWKDDRINLEVTNNLIYIQVPIKVRAKAGFNLSKYGINVSHYEDTEFSLVINYVTKVQVDKNWQVNTHTNGNGFDWITEPELKLGPVKIPVTSLVDDIIDKQQAKIAREMDQQVRQNISIKEYIDQAWDIVTKPRKVSENVGAWLKIEPHEVYLSPLNEEGGLLKITLGIKGSIETVIGNKPDMSHIELPELSTRKMANDSFKIKFIGSVSHAKANKMLQQYLKGKTYEFRDGKKAITIDKIGLYGHGGEVVVKSKVTGDVNGNVYLKGLPYIDNQHHEIRVKHLDFDIDTKNKLLNTATWLAKGALSKKIDRAFRLPFKQELDSVKTEIRKYISKYPVNNYLLLDGNLESLKPERIMILPDYFAIEIVATGNLSLHVSGI